MAHERRLREKITIMSLLDLISSRPPEARAIALADIGARTKLDTDGVEFLLMKVRAWWWRRGSRPAVHVREDLTVEPVVKVLRERWLSLATPAFMDGYPRSPTGPGTAPD